ncbi:MAG TPA: efflux RND transporter periplasmic adaptor subunit [Candidatus Eisenbacteria bacterium]|nr:efflux RND transporter periplasmic adaptor subunit [Candidatus Eisenbacteria bacterium]
MTRFELPRGRARALALLAAASLAAAGCQGKAGGGFSMPPMPVETAAVKIQSVSDRFEAVGTIEAGEAITVVSEIDAVVETLPFREGQPIGAGGLIAQLDDETAKAETQRAEALRDQSRVTYERVKALFDERAAAPQDLDDAAAALKVAEANLTLARERLKKTRVTAPFAGLAGSKRVSPGAYLRAGSVITDLAYIREIKVSFSAPERYLGSLQRGRQVFVSTAAFPGHAVQGRIDVVNPVLNEATRSADIIARVPNPGGRFRPGMSADVSVILSQRAAAVTVPSEAVFSEGGQTLVYVVKPDSTVERTVLTLGTRQQNVVEVLSGVPAGARIVTAGLQKLFPGAKVIPVESTVGAAPGAPGAAGGAPAAGGGEAAPKSGAKDESKSGATK